MKIMTLEIGGFPILLLRADATTLAYVNACPHQFLPLDFRGSNILSGDGRTLRCSNHDAAFDASTGKGVEGFGLGCSLDPVPIEETAEGWLVITKP